jgi:hypothetical protein
MAAQEENVLVIRDPSLNDENDWEEFSLVDVKVNLPNKSRYANVLTASEDNPLEVSGRLEEVEDSQRHLGMSSERESPIVVCVISLLMILSFPRSHSER